MSDPRDLPSRQEVTENGLEVDRDDVQLMKRIAAGDRLALTALYDRYSGIVFGLCRRVLGNEADAEDALIDTFFELWEKADHYNEDRSAVRSYVLMLARCRAIDRQRSGRTRRDRPVETVRLSRATVQPSTEQPDGPADVLVGRECGVTVQAALAGLTPTQREAVELAFFDGLSHRQIARALGQPLGTIKTRIRQGLIHLRESLRTYAQDEGT